MAMLQLHQQPGSTSHSEQCLGLSGMMSVTIQFGLRQIWTVVHVEMDRNCKGSYVEKITEVPP